jgi:NitT/TauT family transport system permease protein
VRRWSGVLGAVLTVGLFLAGWSLAARLLVPAEEGQLVLLPGPIAVTRDLRELLVDQGFARDVLQSVMRITLGLLASAVPAFALGLVLGMKPRAYAAAEPLFSFASYVPPTAFIPILILWLGIGLPQQIALLFLGTFFHLTINVAETVARTPKAFYDAALTLGARRRQLVFKLTIPYALPEFFQHLRTVVALAWTYLVVAEMVAAETGIGRVIINSQRFLLTGRVLAGVLVIGLLGILSNKVFLVADRLLCRWKHT